MYCIKCGRPINDNSRFCIYCGAPVTTVPQRQNPAYAPIYPAPAQYVKPPARRKKRVFAIIIPVLALAIIAGVIIGISMNPAPGDSFKLGPAITVAEQDISTSGGTVTVKKSGSAIDGLTISVPSSSYTSKVSFTVSEAAIKTSNFPSEFKILTPLIKVENGGAASSNMMLVKIPCKLPKDHIPLAFYCDEKTGALETLPVLSSNAETITVGLRHFSDVIAGSVSKSNAENMDNFDTHFRPGMDDFHMINYGSAICTKGHCGGQSLTTIWYYTYRTLPGGDQLWDKYDNYGKNASIMFRTRDFQYDDVMPLRMASVVQEEATWDSDLREQFIDACKKSAEQTFYGIIYAMKLTKMPQLIDIANSDGSIGHAIVAYRSEGKKIYVADPNYPGKQDRYIEFLGGSFLPYSSARTRDEADRGQGVQFTRFAIVGFTAMYDPPKLEQLWTQFENRTIGDAYFPEIPTNLYTKIKTPEGEKEEEIVDGYKSSALNLKITRESALDAAYSRSYYVSDGNGKVSEEILKSPDGTYAIPLKIGDNYIGTGLFKNVNNVARWYDFKWVKVTYALPRAYKFKMELSLANASSSLGSAWEGELAINSDGTVSGEFPGGIGATTRLTVNGKYVGTYIVSAPFGVKITGTLETAETGLTLRLHQESMGYSVLPIGVKDGQIDEATLESLQKQAEKDVAAWLKDILTDHVFIKVDSRSSYDLSVNGWKGTLTLSPVQ